jgi:Metallo-peptidase family M12B Reprolysin-like
MIDMVASLRDIADRCLGLKDGFSVVRDFFGYQRLAKGTDSLLTQVKLLSSGKHIGVNVIYVGSDLWLNEDFIEVDAALRKMRAIYAQVNIAIAHIGYYTITTAMAPGREHINDDDEAFDLTNEYTVPNDGLDVFMVLTYGTPAAGISEVDGPCDKNDGWFTNMSGSVVAIRDSSDKSGKFTGLIMAHEVGHYLGLKHYKNAQDRLMYPTSDGNNVRMVSAEGNKMRDHCLTFKCNPSP